MSDTIDIEPPPLIPFYVQTWFLASIGMAITVVVTIAAFLKLRKG